MNKFLFITTILMGMISKNEPKVEVVRSLFYEAASNKSAAEKFSRALSEVDNNSSPVLLCYKGVAEMILAKHVFNPFNKLEKFRNGKILIEESIVRDPEDLELRFLRFSIQSNLPGFLGYDEEIFIDKTKLINGYSTIKDTELKSRILSYLSDSKYCSIIELKKLTK
ncbi:hypothetical protein [Pedobacter sp. JCM 36344]|uniref:hypothetical protein n=1 Tax=Pedobacter sp. JCM 36344 TaxID=3374280 RepID=UPI00397E6AAD